MVVYETGKWLGKEVQKDEYYQNLFSPEKVISI